MKRVRSILLALGAAILAIGLSCMVYDRTLLTEGDAGVGDASDGASDATSSCAHAAPPERPKVDDPAVLDGGELTFTVSHFEFAPYVNDAGALRGYDLDRSCTCPDVPSCKSTKQQCDDEAGRDNVGGVQLDTFSKFATAFTPDNLNDRLGSGIYGFLLRVRNWNGSPNDGTVELALYVSKGTELVPVDAGAGDGGKTDAGKVDAGLEHVIPKFDGKDVFTVAKSSVLGGVAPPYIPLPDAVDTTAYVKDGVLVASGTTIKVELSTNNAGLNYLEMNLTGVTVSARIVKVNDHYELQDGLIAGRWPVRKFLNALAPLNDPIGNGTLCGDSSTYATIKDFACGNADISSAVQNDNTNASCDSFSTALGFRAVPVTFGTVQAGITLPQPCGPAWNDDCPAK
jgi:hypothetical protein